MRTYEVPEEQLINWQHDLKLWIMRSANLEPTVPEGSTLLVQTRLRVIRRGDIVVFKAPAINMPYLWVLRIGLIPGDALPESRRRDGQPCEVPESHYWLEGGVHAYDSRYFGTLPVTAIRGIVLALLQGGPPVTIERQPYAGPL